MIFKLNAVGNDGMRRLRRAAVAAATVMNGPKWQLPTRADHRNLTCQRLVG